MVSRMSDEKKKRVVESVDHLVIDVSSMCFKHAAKNKLFTSEGLPSGHILGVFKEVRALVRGLTPKKTIFCYDRGSPWRRELVPSYKATRRPPGESEIERGAIEAAFAQPGSIRLPPLPLDYPTPIFDCERLLRCFPGVHMAALGSEGDDMVALWCSKNTMEERTGPLAIISQDHDLYQLVSDDQHVYSFIKKKVVNRPRPLAIWVDEEEVEFQHGVHPKQLARWKALTGDPSDNIGGLKGGSKPGKKQALRTWLGTTEADAYFSDGWTGTPAKIVDWLQQPLVQDRDRVLKNLEVVDLNLALSRIVGDPIMVSEKGDVGNALAVLIEFEAETVLEQVASLFETMSFSSK